MSDENIIEVGTRVDTAPLDSGTKTAVQLVQNGTQQMATSYQQLTAAVRTAVANLNDANEQLGASAAAGNAQAKAAIAEYEAELASAQVAVKNFAASAETVSTAVAHQVPQFAAASAAVRLLEGNTTGSIRAAERFLATTLQLGPVLQAAFPVVGAIAMIGVLEHVAQKFNDLSNAAVGWTSKLQAYYKSLIEDNNKLLASFDNQQQGMQRVAQLNQRINELEQQKVAAEAQQKAGVSDLFDTTGIAMAISGSLALKNIQDQLVDAYKLRTEMLQNLTKIEQDNSKEAQKAGEQELKDAEAQAREKQREIQQMEQATNRVILQAHKGLNRDIEQDDKDQEQILKLALDDEMKSWDDALKHKKEALKQEVAAYRQSLDDEMTAAKEAFSQKTQQINTEYQEHLISYQRRAELMRQAATEEIQIEQQVVQAKLAIDKLDPDRPEQYQKDLEQMRKLDQQYQSEIQKINDQARNAELAKWQSFFNTFKSSFSSAINGVLQGTQTFGQAMSRIADQILLSFIKMLENWVVDWIQQHAVMAAIAATTQKAVTVQQIQDAAAQAGANTFAAISAIPIVGPEMAPGAAAASVSEVESFDALAFAKGGIVPEDALSFVHKNEMVLPASISKGMQDMIEAGGGASGHTFNLHFNEGAFGNVQDPRAMVAGLIPELRRAMRLGKLTT